MRRLLICLAVLSFLPLVFAVPNLEVEKIDNGSVIISELDNPAIFDLVINNFGESEKFKIYSLVGVDIKPDDFFELGPGKTTIEITAKPGEEIRKLDGFVKFEYQIYGQKSGIFKDELLVKVVSLGEAIDLSAKPLSPNEEDAVVVIGNKEDAHLDNLQMVLESVFFETVENVSLGPQEYLEISVPITKDTQKLVAGPYVISAEVSADDSTVSIEGIVDYLEKEGTSVSSVSEGFTVRKTTSSKKNVGNTPIDASIEIKKDVVSRLFTVNSPLHSSVRREGLITTYVWQENLHPNEELVVKSTTNYTFPFIVLILIAVIVLSLKFYIKTPMVLEKKVSHVRTKGGEFALKVNLFVKAKKHLDAVHITDVLPGSMKLYENYGTKPRSVSAESRRVSWNLKKMNAGETRVVSYIIYSKIRTFGRFELPSAFANFEFDGQSQQVFSDRVFFVSDTAGASEE
jgi:hypothetical protein